MGEFTEQKLEFLQEVSEIKDEKTLAALIAAYHEIVGNGKPAKTTRKKFDADAIRHRRGRVGHDKVKIMQLIREMDVQEPIEQLLSQLTK